MGALDAVNVPQTSPNQEVEISVGMTAPSAPGNHTGYWQLRNAQGTHFGPKVSINIKVQGNETSGTSEIDLVSLEYPTVVSPGQSFLPKVTVRVNQGQLLESRGDFLQNTDGQRFGAHLLQKVFGTVNAGQTYTFTFSSEDPMVAPSDLGGKDSRWRVWRNGAWAGPEIDIHFDVVNGGGTRPDAPTLISPGNWYVSNDGSTPQLCASAPGGLQYFFKIFESQDTPESGWINSNCWTPPGLGTYGYQWHAQVRNPGTGLVSDWSETRHFNILSYSPTISDYRFNPPSPSAADNIQFYACADTEYEMRINTASDGSTNGEWIYFGGGATTCNPSDPNHWRNWFTLPFDDGTHAIRLLAFKNGQTRIYETSYTLQRRKPNGPAPIGPTEGIWLNSLTVPISWKPTSRTQYYNFDISTDGAHQNRLVNLPGQPTSFTSYTATFTQPYPDLYWRIDAFNELGHWGNGGSFHLDIVNPTSQVTALPASVSEPNLVVQWGGSDDRSGVRWYNIQYREGNRPDSRWMDWQTATTKIADVFIGQPGHTYYFQSQALDVAGNLEAFPLGDGDTHTTIDINSRPVTPWWNASYLQKRALQILNNDPQGMPAGYPVHLHFDSTTTPSSSDIYAGSLAAQKGDDVRITYNDSVELSRFIQAFSSTQIDLWFNLQTAIASNPGSDTTSYQLYYGNASPAAVASDPNSVFSPKVDGNTLGFWRLNEGSGSTVYDSSGHGYTGSASNMSWTDGKFGPAGSFNGTNTLVNLGSSDAFNLKVLTAEAWIQFLSSDGERSIFRKESADTSLIYDVLTDYNKAVLRLNGNSCSVVGNTQFQRGQWYHVAWVYDGNTASVYLNGRLDKSSYCGSSLREGHTTLWMGGDGRSNNKFVQGSIQLARISNAARSSYPYGAFGDIHTEPTLTAGVPIYPPVQGAPDLAIQSVSSYPNPGGGLIIQTVVTNRGNQSTGNGFNTDLYLDHLPTGTGDYSGSVRFWVNDPIPAGATVTLTTTLPDSGVPNIQALTPGQEVHNTVYIQTDTLGLLNDTDRANNISSGTDVCTATADAFEGDDSPASASNIAFGEIQQHNFTTPADQDWMRFQAEGGKKYSIQTLNLAAAADTYLYVYDQDGTSLLASNDDTNGSLASLIEWTAPATGNYYLLVTGWNPSVSGCGTRYDIQVGSSTKMLYLPNISTKATTGTLQVTGLAGDVEIGQVHCPTWSGCRNASQGNWLLDGNQGATVSSDYYPSGSYYDLKRVFLYFDTSAIPDGVAISGVELHVYAGRFQSGSNQFHVVRSTAGLPASASDYSRIGFVSAGSASPPAESWSTISLSSQAYSWINQSGITSFALIQDPDLNNRSPSTQNNLLVSMSEEPQHQPYLIVRYLLE